MNAYILRGVVVTLRHDGAGTYRPRISSHGRAAPGRAMPQSDRHTQNTALTGVACGRAWEGESARQIYTPEPKNTLGTAWVLGFKIPR